MSAKIHLGTSAFTAPRWPGSFYPAGIQPSEYLTFHAEHFDTVEVDSTFCFLVRRGVAGIGRVTGYGLLSPLCIRSLQENAGPLENTPRSSARILKHARSL